MNKIKAEDVRIAVEYVEDESGERVFCDCIVIETPENISSEALKQQILSDIAVRKRAEIELKKLKSKEFLGGTISLQMKLIKSILDTNVKGITVSINCENES
jgi:hypothetical protein